MRRERYSKRLGEEGRRRGGRDSGRIEGKEGMEVGERREVDREIQGNN